MGRTALFKASINSTNIHILRLQCTFPIFYEILLRRIMDVNIKGTLCITKVATKKMIANGKGGSIVNISSAVIISSSILYL